MRKVSTQEIQPGNIQVRLPLIQLHPEALRGAKAVVIRLLPEAAAAVVTALLPEAAGEVREAVVREAVVADNLQERCR